MCKRFTMLTWDETMSVVRSLEAHAPLNPVPDWPARRIDAFPDAEVSVIAHRAAAPAHFLAAAAPVIRTKAPTRPTATCSRLCAARSTCGPCVGAIRCPPMESSSSTRA